MTDILSFLSLKAIPTEYGGIRFRSRLEARWAVFFDALQVPWCYEAEGYKLPDGTMYLPDFYLPRWECTVEVKGVAEPGEIAKCAVLSECLRRRVVLLEGFPALGSYHVLSFHPNCRQSCNADRGCRFAHDRRDQGVFWLLGDECACILDKPITDHDRWPIEDDLVMVQAYEAARRRWSDYRAEQ